MVFQTFFFMNTCYNINIPNKDALRARIVRNKRWEIKMTKRDNCVEEESLESLAKKVDYHFAYPQSFKDDIKKYYPEDMDIQKKADQNDMNILEWHIEDAPNEEVRKARIALHMEWADRVDWYFEELEYELKLLEE